MGPNPKEEVPSGTWGVHCLVTAYCKGEGGLTLLGIFFSVGIAYQPK